MEYHFENEDSVESLVVKDYFFHGLTRDEIAAKHNRSEGTVTNINAAFMKRMNNADLWALRSFAQAAHKSKTSVTDMVNGSRVYALMARAGISSDDHQVRFIELVGKAIQAHISPESVGKAISAIVELQKKVQVPIDQIPDALEGLQKKHQELEGQLAADKIRINASQSQLKEALALERVTREQLKDFVQVRDSLGIFSIPIENAQKVHQFLLNMQESGHSPKEAAESMTQAKSLNEQRKNLQAQIDILSGQIHQLQTQVDSKRYELDMIRQDVKAAQQRRTVLIEETQKVDSSVKVFESRVQLMERVAAQLMAGLNKGVMGTNAVLTRFNDTFEQKLTEVEVAGKRLEKSAIDMGGLRVIADWICGKDVDELELLTALITINEKRKHEKIVKTGRSDTLTDNYGAQLRYELESLQRRRRVAAFK